MYILIYSALISPAINDQRHGFFESSPLFSEITLNSSFITYIVANLFGKWLERNKFMYLNLCTISFQNLTILNLPNLLNNYIHL